MPNALLPVACALLMMTCACSVGQTSPATRPTSQPAFAGVTYHRTGGFAGTDDRITITSEGKITVKGRLIGQGEGQLDAAQIAQLVKLFEGWEKLADAYKPKDVVSDGFEIEIRYGDKTVKYFDGAADTPATLMKVVTHLPKLAQAVTAPPGR